MHRGPRDGPWGDVSPAKSPVNGTTGATGRPNVTLGGNLRPLQETLMRIIALATAATLAIAPPLLAQDKAYDAYTTVATVNGKDITLGHMIALLERLPDRYRELGDDVLFPGILDQLVDQALISDTLSGDAADDPARVRLILENERWAILSNQVVDNIAGDGPTDEELQAAYEEAVAGAEPKPEYNASHILVETEDEAKELVTTLEGGADFAELAREKSTGPSGPNGGSLGWFGPGAMVPPFDQAVQAMDVGSVSAPVQTQFGWHVIKLNDFRDKPGIDDMREDLSNQILRGKIDAALETMRAAATVTRPEHGIPAEALRDSSLID